MMKKINMTEYWYLYLYYVWRPLEARWWIAVICPILMIILHNLPLQSDTLTQTLHPTATQHCSEILRACTQNGPVGKEKHTHRQRQLPLSHTHTLHTTLPRLDICKAAPGKMCVHACVYYSLTDMFGHIYKKNNIKKTSWNGGKEM